MSRQRRTSAWLQAHSRDTYVRRARAEGYRSRAAYKLAQIDARHRLLHPGMTVIDLGAAPGGWSQYAAERLGDRGRVFAVDLLAIAPLSGVECVRGDITDPRVLDLLIAHLAGTPADVVISDLSPNISGERIADQARALGLATRVLELAEHVLKPGGDLLLKAFQGEAFPQFRRAMQGRFARVVSCKPEASRSRSREMYLLGRGFHPPARAGGGSVVTPGGS